MQEAKQIECCPLDDDGMMPKNIPKNSLKSIDDALAKKLNGTGITQSQNSCKLKHVNQGWVIGSCILPVLLAISLGRWNVICLDRNDC